MPKEALEQEEQTTEEEGAREEEFSAAFNEVEKEGSSDTKKEEEEKTSEKAKDEEGEEKTGEKAKEIEEEEGEAGDESEDEEEEEKEAEAEELDDIEKRGKELIDEEAKAEEERKKSEAEERRKSDEQKRVGEQVPPLTNEIANQFIKMIPRERLAEKIKIDGFNGEINLQSYLTDNPEVALIAAIMTEELMMNYIGNSQLFTANQVKSEINKAFAQSDDAVYSLAIQTELVNMGHTGVKLDELVESKGFDEWGDKQNDHVKALFRSGNPRDYAMGIERYLKDTGMAEKKANAKKIDREKAKEKERHDELHGSTMRSKSGAPTEPSADDTQAKEDFRAGFKEALEED